MPTHELLAVPCLFPRRPFTMHVRTWSADQRGPTARTRLSWPWMARSPRPPCRRPRLMVTVTHDGWEADCKDGTVQDMLDVTANPENIALTNTAYLGAAARMIETIRDPDGNRLRKRTSRRANS